MRIIQEIPSYDGMIHTNVIADVLGMSRADNQYLKGFTLPQWVIWCRLPLGKRYPIAGFPNSNKRDEVYKTLKGATSNVMILDYNECFTDPIMTTFQVKNMLENRTNLHVHLKQCMQRIVTTSRMDFVSLLDLDAFKDFSITHMHRWNENIPMLIDKEREIKYSKIWAKSLYVPRKYLNMGMTPLQFFDNLIKINNETVNETIDNTRNPSSH
jgi:hypothetical protein